MPGGRRLCIRPAVPSSRARPVRPVLLGRRQRGLLIEAERSSRPNIGAMRSRSFGPAAVACLAVTLVGCGKGSVPDAEVFPVIPKAQVARDATVKGVDCDD